MADFANSLNVFVQAADLIIAACRHYIETVSDHPRDLRMMLVEISTLKMALANIHFLARVDPSMSETIRRLGGPQGSLRACGQSLMELEKLLRLEPAPNAGARGAAGPSGRRPERQRLAQTLATLAAWPLKANRAKGLLNDILRHKAVIALVLSGDMRQGPGEALSKISVSVPIRVDPVEAVVRKYVYDTLKSNHKFDKWPNLLRGEVEDAVTAGAKRMFRLAVCQLDLLSRVKSVSEIRLAIKELPETLEETYERIFLAIPPQERGLVQRTLWMLCAQDQPSVLHGPEQLSKIIVVSLVFETWNLSPTTYYADIIKDACGCLVTVSEHSIELAHSTVKEFLFSPRTRYRYSAHNILRHFLLSDGIVRHRYLESALSLTMSLTVPELAAPAIRGAWLWTLEGSFMVLKNWQLLEESKPQLRSLAVDFLDPRKPHYPALALTLSRVSEDWERIVAETRARVSGWSKPQATIVGSHGSDEVFE